MGSCEGCNRKREGGMKQERKLREGYYTSGTGSRGASELLRVGF
jgi:hypothetical protein